MKRSAAFITTLLIISAAFSQGMNVNGVPVDSIETQQIRVTISPSAFSGKVIALVDYGQDKVGGMMSTKSAIRKGKRLHKFKSHQAALDYLSGKGYTIQEPQQSNGIAGIGSANSVYIMKKE